MDYILVFLILLLLIIIITPNCHEYFKELGGKVSPSTMKLSGSSPINPNITKMLKHGMIDFRDFHMDDDLINEANLFHQNYQISQIPRKKEILTAFRNLNEPMDIVTTFYCNKFLPLFENWLASCKDIDVRKFAISFCLDKESYDRTKELGIQAIYIPKMSGDYTKFGNKSFAETMFYKNSIILDLLTYLPSNILFQDTDLIWLKNPLPYLQNLTHDLAIMYDGPNHHFRNIYANTGFFYLKNNDNTRALMETALGNTAYILSYQGHQKPFDRILDTFERHGILKFTILPEDLFPNGHLTSIPNNAYVYHYSWTSNINEKIKKLKKMNLIFNHHLLDASLDA